MERLTIVHRALLAMAFVLAPGLTAGAEQPATTRPATTPGGPADTQPQKPTPPFPFIHGKAYHVLPETHSDESGYFSLCEGPNGRIFVGTAKYGENAYLVEFDPATEKQRIVIDVEALNGVDRKGMASQSKIHTRNYVGPSGTIYVGSKQGYPKKGESPFDYPGGYLMTYDPGTDKADTFGMIPWRSHGVGDVTADEQRRILYVCTQDDRNKLALWLKYDMASGTYHGLYASLTFYAMTLLTADGTAHVLSQKNEWITHHPDTDLLRVRTLLLDGKPFKPDSRDVPTWVTDPGGRHAYLIYMSEPTLYRIDLAQTADEPVIERLADLLDVKEGKTDSRCALSFGPDGRLYAAIRKNNRTGFGKGMVHHLVRYDPQTGKAQDLGVMAVKNPDFFDFGPGPDGKKKPWSHGYHTLPDGTLTPLHVHLALIATRSGDVYVTILAPFTLFRFEGIAKPTP